MAPPAKRAKLLDESDSDEGGVPLDRTNADSTDFKINQEFARRFEHNKKREEKHRLEEKYGKQSSKPSRNANDDEDDDDEDDSSTSESEDDEGELATADLDAEISATLNALRSKDPRVYDKDAKFYRELDDAGAQASTAKKEKPMYLRDYHRKNILEGNIGAEEGDGADDAPKTYAQEQQDLKDSIVKELHAAAADEESDEPSDGEDAFLVAKSKPATSKARPAEQPAVPDVATAEKDPETFLSNFMASRAWVPMAGSKFLPFESDDEEEDERAEAFEHAYNMRFEDPEEANKTLMTHSREAIAQHSVRREETNTRKKRRDRERQKKEEEKEERAHDKARLKKLMIEEMEEKAQKIREAANLRGKDFKMEEWVGILNEDWDDDKWEEVINSKFGDHYYADPDAGDDDGSDSEGADEGGHKKPKKPKWDDDIDIKDIIPDFEDEDDKPAFTLSSDDEAGSVEAPTDDEDVDMGDALPNGTKSNSKNKKKERLRAAAEKKRAAKRDHRIIASQAEQLLDVGQLPAASSSTQSNTNAGPTFRYRETSPSTFGLTPLEILTASDAQLNQFVGLKKLFPFRDEERKRKDKKKLGKKARLREWRRDVFGRAEGSDGATGANRTNLPLPHDAVHDGRIEKSGKKKRRRGKKAQAQQLDGDVPVQD